MGFWLITEIQHFRSLSYLSLWIEVVAADVLQLETGHRFAEDEIEELENYRGNFTRVLGKDLNST